MDLIQNIANRGEDVIIKKATPANIRSFRSPSSAIGVRFAKVSNVVIPGDDAANSPTPVTSDSLMPPKLAPSEEAFKSALAKAYALESEEDGLLDAEIGATLADARKRSPKKRRLAESVSGPLIVRSVDETYELEEVDDLYVFFLIWVVLYSETFSFEFPCGVLSKSSHGKYWPMQIKEARPPAPLVPGEFRSSKSLKVTYVGQWPWDKPGKTSNVLRSAFFAPFDDGFHTCPVSLDVWFALEWVADLLVAR